MVDKILVVALLVSSLFACTPEKSLQTRIDEAVANGEKVVKISGKHTLSSPLLLNEKHSGLQLIGDNSAVITGAKVVNFHKAPITHSFKSDKNFSEECWFAKVDCDFVDFIFVNGQRVECASGEFKKIARVPEGDKKTWNTMIVKNEDIADFTSLASQKNLAFEIIVNWQQHRYRIAKIEKNSDNKTSTLFFDIPKGRFVHMLGHNVFKPINSSKYLKEGSFIFDFDSKILIYKARKNENISNTKIEIPTTPYLVKIEDTENISIKNVKFKFCKRDSKDYSIFDIQATCDLNGAVMAKNAKNIVVEDCEFSNLDTYAVEFRSNVKGANVERCKISDIAGGGIKVGIPKSKVQSGLDASDIVEGARIHNNIICKYGRGFWAACGVLIFDCPNNEVSNNTIFDGYYSGVSCGWTWLPVDTYAHSNKIINNRIFKIGQGMMSDLAGIYTLGKQPHSIVSGNEISDVYSRAYGGNGIYCDEASFGITVENNYIHNCGSGINLHIPRTVVIRNNVVDGVKNNAFCLWMTKERYREDLLKDNVITNNIFVFNKDAKICIRIDKDQRVPIKTMDCNAYFNPDRQNIIFFNEKSKTKGQRFDFFAKDIAGHNAITGRDGNSVFENPMLKNSIPQNTKLCEKIGFKPFSTANAGVYGVMKK